MSFNKLCNKILVGSGQVRLIPIGVDANLDELRVVMVARMMKGFKINFCKIIMDEMDHKGS